MVFGTMRLTGDLQKCFRKISKVQFFVFKRFPVKQDGFFAVFSWVKGGFPKRIPSGVFWRCNGK